MFGKYIHRAVSAFLLFFVFIAPSVAQNPPAAAPQPPPMPHLDVYGFVMTDFGYDLRTNDPNWFDVNRPTKLPSFDREFGRDGKIFAGVRQTKFGVKGYEPTPWGELRTQFEFDMFGV